MMRMNHILQIAELSETEGVFTTAQAACAGIPRDALSYGEKAGRIVRVMRGAYRLAGTRSAELDELSAIWKLTAPALFTYERAQANGWDGFVVGGASAASLLGLGDFYFSPHQLYAPQRFSTRLPYGSCLYDLGRYAEAVEALHKAIRWNPASAQLRFELAENYKRLGYIGACEAALEAAYPCVANGAQMAKWHREKAFVAVERGQLELAAAHLVASMAFEPSDLAVQEMLYIREKFGRDFPQMSGGAAVRVLEERGRPVTADADTIAALADLVAVLRDEGQLAEAASVAGDVYDLTGDETARRAAEELRAQAGE